MQPQEYFVSNLLPRKLLKQTANQLNYKQISEMDIGQILSQGNCAVHESQQKA